MRAPGSMARDQRQAAGRYSGVERSRPRVYVMLRQGARCLSCPSRTARRAQLRGNHATMRTRLSDINSGAGHVLTPTQCVRGRRAKGRCMPPTPGPEWARRDACRCVAQAASPTWSPSFGSVVFRDRVSHEMAVFGRVSGRVVRAWMLLFGMEWSYVDVVWDVCRSFVNTYG